MPGLGIAEGSIAGVTLDLDGSECEVYILDGANLKSTRHTNSRQAADATVYTASMDHEGKGLQFGVLWKQAPLTTLQDVIDAINDALEDQLPFNVNLTDGFHTINASCKVDGKDWLSYGNGRIIQYIDGGVTMRFKTV